MTPEQKREQWLKRLLPALGVLVIYFVVISGFITSKTKKAEDEYKALVSKGINASTLPIRQQDQHKLKEELAKLEAEEKSIRDSLAANSGFLAGKATQNDTLDKLSVILASHSLQILEEKRNDNVDLSNLPKSFGDMQKYLGELSPAASAAQAAPVTPTPTTAATVKANAPSTVNVWTIRYRGSYSDNYHALSALLSSHIKVLPVSLTMQTSKTNNGPTASGQLEWILMLWL